MINRINCNHALWKNKLGQNQSFKSTDLVRVLCIMLINDIKTAFDMTAVSARDATNKDKIMSLN